MDFDDSLRSIGLPDRPIDVEHALGATVRRGRDRRRRLVGGAAVVAMALVGGLLAVATQRHGDADDPMRLTTDPPVPTSLVPSEPEPGDDATWTVHGDHPPRPSAVSFVALVTRTACNDGVTGKVLRPGVELTDDQVVVSFTVEPQPAGSYTCPGNPPTTYRVEVGQPIGDRALVDGGCRPGGAAVRTTFCEPDGIRWRPTEAPAPTPDPHECDADDGSDLDVAGEPAWRQHAPYVPWTDAGGCLLRIDLVAERPGPDHCGWEDAQVLIVGRPIGSRYRSSEDTAHYVRDPEGVFGLPELTDAFGADATLPPRAVDTGYRSEGRALWWDRADAAAVWLVSADGVERWPLGDPPLCM